jgi:PKD repeat protein
MGPAVRLAAGVAAVVLALLWAPAAARAETPPVAAFSVSPPAPVVGQVVAFADRSLDAEGPIANREWDLDGDGAFDPQRTGRPRVTRRFLRAACFTIRLRVTDSAGNTAQAIRVVAVSAPPAPAPVCPPAPEPPPPTIVDPPVEPPVTPPANQAPTAAFAFSPLMPQIGEAVGFAATAGDPDGTVAAYAWDLDGDGAFDDASGPTAQTAYATAGTRTISLQVTDNQGLATVTSRSVEVSEPTGGVLGETARPQRLSPFPVVRLTGTVRGRVVRVRRLAVDAPDGVTISVRCYGRGCPARRPLTTTLVEGRIVRVRRLERRLRPGIVIKILITRPGWIGKYTRFRIRSGKPPSRQDRCVSYGRTRPRSCSTS